MKLIVFSLFLVAANAQDIAGRWTGAASTIDEAGTKRQESHNFEIKSEDGKFTGVMLNALLWIAKVEPPSQLTSRPDFPRISTRGPRIRPRPTDSSMTMGVNSC